jgi:hypothetical protein
MFDRQPPRPSILIDVAQDCEYLLVEAALGFASEREWKVRSSRGREYRAVLTVDEWTDSPLVEIRNPKSGEVVQRVAIGVTAWLIK